MEVKRSASVGSSSQGVEDGRQDSYEGVLDARPLLPKAAFFLGDLRDGLPMLNMQAAFLISSKEFSEKQIGVLFLAFGLSQFICMAPAGYFLDYSNNKINWVIGAGFATSALTILTPLIASPNGANMPLMILSKVMQGAFTSILPPGFNSITLGIVGSTGFTYQVSRNRMMNHIGSALVVAIGSLIAYLLYPNIGALFIVSPLATIGMYYNLAQIKPNHIDRDAARCLIIESPTMNEYEHLDTQNSMEELADPSPVGSSIRNHDKSSLSHRSQRATDSDVLKKTKYIPPSETMPNEISSHVSLFNAKVDLEDHIGETVTANTANPKSYASGPSFNFGWSKPRRRGAEIVKVQAPIAVLLDPTLVTFTLIVFFFHLANSSVLPLVMQSLALQDPQAGLLLSGLCILIAQGFMSYFAKVAGDFSPKWGRKGLCMLGLSSLTLRCFLLTILSTSQVETVSERQLVIVNALILSTQLLDSCGAGLFNCLQILITNDISMKTGRFSLMLGVTTGAMCAGATISGYIGQAIAQDHGYPVAFTCLGVMSLVPIMLMLLIMPETLPDHAKPKERRRRLLALWKKVVEQRRKLALRANPFRRQKDNQVDAAQKLDPELNQDASLAEVVMSQAEIV